ncbi:hypothetical protein EOL73_00005 [Candidatus Saccharibacteria bacterium]|nr:hypothetical protein [Candidatus Saccharibacteria bacterium]
MKLGTILPTAKSERINQAFKIREDAFKKSIAEKHGLKNGIDTGTEIEYITDNEKRIVGSDGRIRVFTIKSDGDYFKCFEGKKVKR